MRALAPMPRESLHDLPHHTEQLAVAVYLPGTVTLGASQLTYGTQACGRAASLRISMSRAWSAASFFSLEFSF